MSDWMNDDVKRALIVFVGIPLLLNALVLGLYFSGVAGLQQIVAPTIDWLLRNSWREFGLLEQLQNLFLLGVIAILFLGIFTKNSLLDKTCMLGGSMVFVFLLLEEIDYGIHFYEFFKGENSGIRIRNWHNQENDGEQNVKRFKQIMDTLMFLLFILLPLLKNKIPIQFLKNIAPSRWFILGFVLVIGYANLAHFLDDRGQATINGLEGNLSGNISEFRELSNYYFFLIYALQLYKLEEIFGGRPRAQ